MRVVLISASDGPGGAQRASERLHRALLAIGVESTLLVGRKTSAAPEIEQIEIDPDSERPDLDQLFRRTIDRDIYRERRSEMSNTLMSFPYPGIDLADHPAIRAADIIHLHWVTRVLSPLTIQRLGRTGKPVVWTLHDQAPFTGGCHYAAGCEGYRSNCFPCPQLDDPTSTLPGRTLLDRHALLAGAIDALIAPSRWMAAAAAASVVFRGCRIEVIKSTLFPDAFHHREQGACRSAMGLPRDEVLIAFGATSLAERRKGAAPLCVALAALAAPLTGAAQPAAELVLFGREGVAVDWPLPIHRFDLIRDDFALACLLGAADLTAVPSLEDNYPNIALESLACGVPVVAFPVGGLPDLVTDRSAGILAGGTTAADLAAGLVMATRRVPGWRAGQAHLSERTLLHHDPEHIAGAHVELFADLLRQRPRRYWPRSLLARRRRRSKLVYDLGPGLGDLGSLLDSLPADLRPERWLLEPRFQETADKERKRRR